MEENEDVLVSEDKLRMVVGGKGKLKKNRLLLIEYSSPSYSCISVEGF
jgi:hypothetical protein